MYVYLAGPLFNEPQLNILRYLERTLEENGFDFFSPRLHSGSHKILKEERLDRSKWESVFSSNIQAMEKADIMVGVVDYLREAGDTLCVQTIYPGNNVSTKGVYLPDTGTVFEVGYFKALKKPVYAYTERDIYSLNLMLTHSFDGLIAGKTNFRKFFSKPTLDLKVCEDLGKVRSI